MAGYIYLPVNTEEMRNFAKDWQEGQRDRGKVAYKILKNFESGWRKGFVRDIGRGVLRGLTAQDKLYVLIHGSEHGSSRVGAARGATKSAGPIETWEGGTLKTYTPDQLAAVVEKEGLLKSFVDLRLFVCGSALIPLAQTKSFAERFALSMGALGYNHLQVTGYLGSVKSSYTYRYSKGKFTDEKHKGVQVNNSFERPSEHKLVFSSQPNAVPLGDTDL